METTAKRKRLYLAISLGLSIVLFILLFPVVLDSERAIRFTITDLGLLPGAEMSEATDVNERGEVVGTSGARAGSRSAFLWRPSTGMNDLGVAGSAARINNRGEVAGSFTVESSNEKILHAFVWSSTEGTRDLGTFGGYQSMSIAINDRGDVLVATWLRGGWSVRDRKSFEPSKFILEASGSVKPITIADAWITRVADLNDSNAVIGNVHSKFEEGDAFKWNSVDGARFPENAGNLRLHRLNNLGEAVGERVLGRDRAEAVLWEGTQVITLTGLGGDSSSARDINDRKQIVGDSVTSVGEIIRAFGRWRSERAPWVRMTLNPLTNPLVRSKLGWQQPVIWEEGEPRNLNDLIPHGSAWTLWDAVAINNNGQIVGTGLIGGELHAYLLTLIERSSDP